MFLEVKIWEKRFCSTQALRLHHHQIWCSLWISLHQIFVNNTGEIFKFWRNDSSGLQQFHLTIEEVPHTSTLNDHIERSKYRLIIFIYSNYCLHYLRLALPVLKILSCEEYIGFFIFSVILLLSMHPTRI